MLIVNQGHLGSVMCYLKPHRLLFELLAPRVLTSCLDAGVSISRSP